MRILMVCLGNICRSPLAEGILKHKASQHNLSWYVDSAGTSHWHAGESPDRRAIAVARQFGIDISQQRARPLRLDDFEHFNLIFAMDLSNLRQVKQQAPRPEHQQKVQLLLDLLYPGQQREVPDPYYGDMDDFVEVFHLISSACDRIIEQYRK